MGLILIASALYITIPSFTQDQQVSLGNFDMSAQSYNSITDKFGEEEKVIVCNFEKENCVVLWNID